MIDSSKWNLIKAWNADNNGLKEEAEDEENNLF